VKHPRPVGHDTALGGLIATIDKARSADRLAPVTVVVPSRPAAVSTRRAVASREGIANVNFVSVMDLIRALAAPRLVALGVDQAPMAVELEVTRERATSMGGRLGALARHRGFVDALVDSFSDLRGAGPEIVDAIAMSRGPSAELASLYADVRRALRDHGFCDSGETAEAAVLAETRNIRALGQVVSFELGPLSSVERAVLRRIGSATPLVHIEARQARPAINELQPCTDPDQEVRTAVRSILEDLESGVPLWRQAVLHPAGTRYARILHQQLELSGVAVNGPSLRTLDTSVTGRCLLGLVELPDSDWQRDRVVAWMNSAPMLERPNGRPVPAGRWDVISAEAGILRSLGEWLERLENLRSRDARAADESVALGTFVGDLVTRTNAGGSRRSWSELADWALGLLDRYLPLSACDQLWPADQSVSAEQVRDAISELGQLDKVSGNVDLRSFRTALRSQLERRRLDTSELAEGGSGNGVYVAPIPSARGMRFDTVIVTGLADAFYPGQAIRNAFLPDEARSVANEALPTRRDRLEHAEADLRAALSTGSVRRKATVPRTDPRTGHEHVECRWIAELSKPSSGHKQAVSFAADLSAKSTALSIQEFGLRELVSVSSRSSDPAASGVVAFHPQIALGFEVSRSRRDAEFSRFDGNVGQGLVSPFDPRHPVSATRLETYAECPRRFLLERELGVSRRKLPEDLWQIEPSERGTLVHSVLERYVVERLEGVERSLGRLLEIADCHFDDAEARGIVGKPLLWRLEKANLRRDLRRFFEEERGLMPLAAELDFGDEQSDRPAVIVTLEDGRGVSFRGRADRVDLTPDGHLVVSDYKTGRQTALKNLTSDPVAKGARLQLPLYAMAARSQFGDRLGRAGLGAARALSDDCGEDRSGENGSCDDGSGEALGGRDTDDVHARYWLLSGERSASCYSLRVTDAVQERFRNVVGLIADGIDAGAFPAIPGESIPGGFLKCSWCDFDSVCPTTRDKQWATKREGSALRPVLELIDGEVPPHLMNAVQKNFAWPNEVRRTEERPDPAQVAQSSEPARVSDGARRK